MPPKPRPAKPRPRKSRAPTPPTGGGRDRMLVYGIAATAIVALAGAFAWIALAGGSSRMSPGEARTAIETGGCSLQAVKAQIGVHSVRIPEGKAKWNTNPPTNGPHFEIPAIYGSYREPLNPAQVVHNLEHGAIFIHYGSRVPQATVDQLQAYYDGHEKGTLLAPVPSLGRQIVLGAWTTITNKTSPNGTAYLARCTSFQKAAFDAFFSAFQFMGPEPYPPDSLLPGRT